MMYPIRLRYSEKPSKANCSVHATAGKVTVCLVWFSVILLLISSGIVYRVLASQLKLVVDTPIKLPVPLSAFPLQIVNWSGRDLPIPNTTREYMERNFADDFLSRRYINAATKAWADVYIVYCSSQPGGILGHRPRVCYPAHGWVHDSTESSQFTSQAGQQIPCLIHRFHKPAPMNNQKVVLNFHVLNGRLISEQNDFSGPLGRRPNIAGDPARYVAQVQISSILESSIRTMAKDVVDLILDYLPDQNGKVRAVEYSNTAEAQMIGNLGDRGQGSEIRN